MRIPDWRNLALDEGVLPEPSADAGRIVLWLPGTRAGGFEHWERVGNVARAGVTVGHGLCATAAVSIQARQRVRGFFGKLARRFRPAPGDRAWTLPTGETAEQCGERQTDLLLVWAEDENTPLDEARLKSCWPESNRLRKVGKNLFLVSGVQPQGAGNQAQQPRGDPREVAGQLLAAARQAGDRRREVSALTDLGVVTLHAGDGRRALALLEEALTIARQAGDRSGESDVLGNLGLAAQATGQPRRALELFEQEVAHARAAGDAFAEKGALERLGLAYSGQADPARALAFFEQALALARQVGDRKHQADLLWHLAIQHAEQGQREQGSARGQAAVDLLRELGNPQAGLYADLLQKYRAGDAGVWPGGTAAAGSVGPPGALLGGPIDVSAGAPAGPLPGPGQAVSGPGLLRMALSAAKSMARFIGSGMKTVSPSTHEKRLRTCAGCPHHTGVRCRLCGCFTNAKAWLPHETCPIGKWPA